MNDFQMALQFFTPFISQSTPEQDYSLTFTLCNDIIIIIIIVPAGYDESDVRL